MIGIKPVVRIAPIALTCLVMALNGAEDRMRAGMWEVTTTVGNETGSLGQTCYTPAMVVVANMSDKMMREATETSTAKRGCTLKDFKIEGKKISMVKVCKANTATIVSTYSGDVFDTVDTQTGPGGNKAIHMKGRRVGDCK